MKVPKMSLKAVTPILVLAFMVWVLYAFGKKITSWIGGNGKTDQEKAAKKTLIDDVAATIQNGSTTIDDIQAENKANIIYGAMNRIGTDEDAVRNELSGLNDDDIKLVFVKFGVKDYAPFFLPAQWLNMIEWFKEEGGLEDVIQRCKNAGLI